MRSVGSGTGTGISGMSESRQLSVVKTRHMAVLVTGTFLFYSTVSTIVFQVCVFLVVVDNEGLCDECVHVPCLCCVVGKRVLHARVMSRRMELLTYALYLEVGVGRGEEETARKVTKSALGVDSYLFLGCRWRAGARTHGSRHNGLNKVFHFIQD